MKQKNKFGIILPIVLINSFLILLDNSVVFTSTVSIAKDLSMTNSSIAWITNIYALMFGNLLLIGGDVYGRKLIFTIGLLIFGLGSLLVGLSTSGNFIIMMGAFQGIGSAIVAPTSLALIIDNYNDDKRERAISYYGITTGLGASIRLIIGGIITTYLSWRWGFLINLPISFVLILLTIKFVPNVYAQKYSKLDYLGTILSTIGFLTLVYGIDGNDYKKISFIVAIILLLLFIVREAIVEKPLMSLKLFNDRQRSSAYIGRFFFAGTMISYFFLVPQTLQSGYGFTPLLSALAFMPEAVHNSCLESFNLN